MKDLPHGRGSDSKHPVGTYFEVVFLYSAVSKLDADPDPGKIPPIFPPKLRPELHRDSKNTAQIDHESDHFWARFRHLESRETGAGWAARHGVFRPRQMTPVSEAKFQSEARRMEFCVFECERERTFKRASIITLRSRNETVHNFAKPTKEYVPSRYSIFALSELSAPPGFGVASGFLSGPGPTGIYQWLGPVFSGPPGKQPRSPFDFGTGKRVLRLSS